MTKKLTATHDHIINIYIKLGKKLGHHPARSDLINSGISRDLIKYYFGNYTKLRDMMHKQDVGLPLEAPNPLPKILLFDIETAPIEAYTWGIWNVNISLNQILEDWSVIAWAAKWLGSDDIMYKDLRASKNKRDDKKLVKEIRDLLDEADIVITQNGKSFDVKKLNTRFLIHGFQPPSSYRHLDTKRINKKYFGFTSVGLDYMCKALNLSYKKSAHKNFPGMELWKECLSNNQEAWKEMESYNKLDVLALEELYKKVAPWEGDVNLSAYTGRTTCKCGNTDLKENGYSYTNKGKYARYTCKSCGAEFKDSKNLVNKNIKAGTQR